MQYDLFRISVDDKYILNLEVSYLLLAIVVVVLLVIWAVNKYVMKNVGYYEVDEAEIGVGSQKVKIKPNNNDMQIAYKLYVELSTRKLGLPIDFDDDVVVEIFNSWYEFFKVTRELIKDIPASKVRNSQSTKDITRFSIDVLNNGLRPVLTKWQARFRRWYEIEISKDENSLEPPQGLQKKFPEYDDLKSDMADVNKKLIFYRNKLRELSIG